jgi:hypothetical protein
MTSAWNKPPSRDDRADGQISRSQDSRSQVSGTHISGPEIAGPDDNQLDMFDVLARAGGRRRRPSASGGRDADGRKVEMIISPPIAARDILDVGGPDSDELRRLEESIRWLMNAGNNMRHLPPAAPLSPIETRRDETYRDDSLILDPETLFSSPAPQRRGDLLRGTAKILLVSAIAAPTAYFVASWAQFPDAAPSDAVAVSTSAPAAAPGVQVAALAFAPAVSEATRGGEYLAKASSPPEHVTMAPVERAPQTAPAPAPVELKVAPEPPSTVAAAPPPLADPGQTARSAPATAAAAIPVAVPPKPSMRPEEIAMMIERGRTLFDAGDLAAARLFFRRAANAGDAGAAVAMGATYDPEVLGQRFIRGIEADAREAQKWYDKARALGGTRTEMLAHR